jgi:F-type H+-transporting ATPase subunit b
MQIDWLTVIAQIVNFLILVWLLRRFLYKPVIDAMDQREQRIAERLQGAEQRERIAANTVQDYQNRIRGLDRQRDELIEKARAAADTERLELLETARGEVAAQRTHWQHQVAEEKQDFLRSLRQHASESVQTIARHALKDLAAAELEEQIIQIFIQKLQALDSETRNKLAATAAPVRLTTAFELNSSLRRRLTRALHEHIDEDIEIVYDESPGLLCGIELTTSGHRLSWSLADYLEKLEQRMQDQLGAIGAGSE